MIKGRNSLDELRERTRKRAEARSRERGLSTLALPEGVSLFETSKGTTEFDILPYKITVDNHPDAKKGDIWYKRLYFIHRNIGPEELTIICPKTIGKRCPICDEYKRLKADPDAEEDIVKALRPKDRELFNILPKGEETIMVLDISTALFGQELDKMINEGEVAIAGFWLLQGGMTLKVRWDSKTMPKRKPFFEAGRIDFEPREDFDDSTLDMTVDLDAAMKIMSFEEIEAIFQGSDGAPAPAEEPEKEEPAPARRVVGRIAGRPPTPTPEEEPGEEAPPTPARRSLRPAPAAPAEEGEEATATGVPDCIACEGAGKTSKGKTCPICGGTGKDTDAVLDEETPAGEPEKEEAPPAPTRRVVGRGPAAAPTPGRRAIQRK